MIEILCSVPPGLVEWVVSHARPADGEVLVLVGTTELTGTNLAECVPRRALATALGSVFRRRAYRTRAWDAGVAVAERTCLLAHTHPAVFAQIIAHELGHATVAVRDPDLHTYCSFLDLTIREASNGRITWYHELPHERAFDAFGNWAAVDLFGAEQFARELNDLIANERPDRERLQVISTLPPQRGLDGLRAEVRAFAAPYRAALERMWDAEVERAIATEGVSITQQASKPISALWE